MYVYGSYLSTYLGNQSAYLNVDTESEYLRATILPPYQYAAGGGGGDATSSYRTGDDRSPREGGSRNFFLDVFPAK